MPKGEILQILQRFVEDEEERQASSPRLPSWLRKILRNLWALEHYRDGMFIIGDEIKGMRYGAAP